MSDNRKDLPNYNSPAFLMKVAEALQTYLGFRGDKLDRGLTVRDLSDAGLISLSNTYRVSGVGGPVGGVGTAVTPAYEEDLTPPPTPSGFAVSAAISSLFFSHDAPVYTQGHGHAKTVVYGATRASGAAAPVFADAVVITEFTGTVFAYATNPATTWHLWTKWVTVDGVASTTPAGGTNGLVVTTGQDVSRLVTAMTGPGNPFTVLATQTVVGGVTFPAGTYSTQAFILDAQITNAKIANAAIDDAKIANLSASKITAGTISADRIAASSITADKIAANTITASQIAAGTITADKIAAGTITSDKIAASTITADKIAAGTITADKINGTNLAVVNGSFSGSLSAATGTFNGTLNVRSATSGARLEITNDVIKVFDATGALRVKIGNLA